MADGRIQKITPRSLAINQAQKITPGILPGADKDFSKFSASSPGEVNKIHTRDDVDKSDFSHHHTLGPGKTQASPGTHTHDGFSSRGIGYGQNLTLTGAKGGNVALTNLIAMLKSMGFVFTDTST